MFAPEFSGPRTPLPATPDRLAGGIRRTTTIDVTRGDDLYGPGVIDARARDLATPLDGPPVVVAEARLTAATDSERVLTAIEAVGGVNPPDAAALAGLLGATVAGGFRGRIAAVLADHVAAGTLWHLLIDDLVGAVLVSGVAPQHVEALVGGGPIVELTREFEDVMFANMSDLCAGWATDATMLTLYRKNHEIPVAQGPDAPTLERADDPWAWHDTAPLVPHAVRRRRRIDLGPTGPDGVAPIAVHFRDSHVDGDGLERCVHEYTVSGGYHVADDRLVAVAADARVLPWRECPGAVASAARASGMRAADLRPAVRADFGGTSTCTHLNDTLRSLADLAVLAAERPTAG